MSDDRYAPGGTLSDKLNGWRDDGHNVICSIKLTMALTGISLGKAKEIVYYSEARRDRRSAHDALHQSIIDGIEQLPSEGVTIVITQFAEGDLPWPP